MRLWFGPVVWSESAGWRGDRGSTGWSRSTVDRSAVRSTSSVTTTPWHISLRDHCECRPTVIQWNVIDNRDGVNKWFFGLYSGSSLLPWPPPLAWQSCFLCTCLGTASCCICRNVWAWQMIPLPNTATAVCIQERYSYSKCVLYMVLITHFRLFFHNSTSITNVCHLRNVLSHWE